VIGVGGYVHDATCRPGLLYEVFGRPRDWAHVGLRVIRISAVLPKLPKEHVRPVKNGLPWHLDRKRFWGDWGDEAACHLGLMLLGEFSIIGSD